MMNTKTICAPHVDKVHELKCWPDFFQLVKAGFKEFEVRKNDRDYQVNDFLKLREYSLETGYTGDKIFRRIKYILKGGKFGIEEGFVVMQLDKARPLGLVKLKN